MRRQWKDVIVQLLKPPRCAGDPDLDPTNPPDPSAVPSVGRHRSRWREAPRFERRTCAAGHSILQVKGNVITSDGNRRMSPGWKRPSLRGALSKPPALLAPMHRSRDEWESLPHTDGEPITKGGMKSGGDRFLSAHCPCRPCPTGTRRSGSHGHRASQRSNMSARGRPVPVCESDSLGDGMAMALMGLYDPDLRIVLYGT